MSTLRRGFEARCMVWEFSRHLKLISRTINLIETSSFLTHPSLGVRSDSLQDREELRLLVFAQTLHMNAERREFLLFRNLINFNLICKSLFRNLYDCGPFLLLYWLDHLFFLLFLNFLRRHFWNSNTVTWHRGMLWGKLLTYI